MGRSSAMPGNIFLSAFSVLGCLHDPTRHASGLNVLENNRIWYHCVHFSTPSKNSSSYQQSKGSVPASVPADQYTWYVAGGSALAPGMGTFRTTSITRPILSGSRTCLTSSPFRNFVSFLRRFIIVIIFSAWHNAQHQLGKEPGGGDAKYKVYYHC